MSRHDFNRCQSPKGAGLGWMAVILAACASSCTLDKLEVVSQLPCPSSSTRPDCVPEAGALGDQDAASPTGMGGGGASGGGDSGGGDSGAGGRSSEGNGGAAVSPGIGGSDTVGPNPPVRVVDKLDLLFMIDNSISMRDKQNVLALVNANLITALGSPPCVPLAEGPGNFIGEPCPEGETRAFQPITDIHIGIITSSLGDAGANVACASGDRVDMAHLLGSLPRGVDTLAAPDGFLRWTVGDDVGELTQKFQLLTRAVGEAGCGWEMSLEAWYRFLVDPYPYRELVKVACPGSESEALNCVQPATNLSGRVVLDDVLLAQREQFLRRDSLVAIVMLTDENDCSLQVGNQSWVVVAVDDARPMFRSSSLCADNPNHPCCYTCPLGAPLGCESDPICEGDAEAGTLPNRLPAAADGLNLRCFDQKRRFGVDFLYPTERYVNALKSVELCPESLSLGPEDCTSAATLVENPLYAGGERTPEDVFLAGIVGVPWQALASSVDAGGNPLDSDVLRFKSAAELGPADWARIVGEPHESPPIPPGDLFMRESSTPRNDIVPGNEINGRDYVTLIPPVVAPDDLEYACIFPLPTERDCSLLDPLLGDACDCFAGANDTPLCEEEPGVSTPGTTQYWAKAYPSLRQLDVLRGYGANSVVTSICAKKVLPEQAGIPDFAYRPALGALVERLQRRLGAR